MENITEFGIICTHIVEFRKPGHIECICITSTSVCITNENVYNTCVCSFILTVYYI